MFILNIRDGKEPTAFNFAVSDDMLQPLTADDFWNLASAQVPVQYIDTSKWDGFVTTHKKLRSATTQYGD